MALVYAAELHPTKREVLAAWLPGRPWAPPGGEVEMLGSYRFDDPEGEVGLETHLLRMEGVLLQVPLTYRDAPLTGAEEHLVGTMQHSELGQRWVYDSTADPVWLRMLAAVMLTGTGQAAEVTPTASGTVVQPPAVRLTGSGRRTEPVVVDEFGPPVQEDGWTVVRTPALELRVARRPVPCDAPPGGIALTGTWAGQSSPVLLAETVMPH